MRAATLDVPSLPSPVMAPNCPQRGIPAGAVSLVVVDENEIYRAGLLACLRSCAGIDVIGGHPLDEVPDHPADSRGAHPDTVLVEVSSPRADRDRYAGVGVVAALRAAIPGPDLTVVATCRTASSPYLALRLAEAGADFFYGPGFGFTSPGELVTAVREPGEAHRSPSQWALREAHGLAWNGDLAAFLAEVDRYPDDLWRPDLRQDQLSVSRRTILQLRRLAHEVAGLPAPDFRRFTGGYREPPTLPEWQQVRAFVADLRGG